MLEIFRKAADDKTVVKMSFENVVAQYADNAIVERIINELVALWVEKYRTEVLETIAPEEVAKLVKQQITDTMAKKFVA